MISAIEGRVRDPCRRCHRPRGIARAPDDIYLSRARAARRPARGNAEPDCRQETRCSRNSIRPGLAQSERGLLDSQRLVLRDGRRVGEFPGDSVRANRIFF